MRDAVRRRRHRWGLGGRWGCCCRRRRSVGRRRTGRHIDRHWGIIQRVVELDGRLDAHQRRIANASVRTRRKGRRRCRRRCRDGRCGVQRRGRQRKEAGQLTKNLGRQTGRLDGGSVGDVDTRQHLSRDHLLADQSQLASNVIPNVDDDEIDGNLFL